MPSDSTGSLRGSLTSGIWERIEPSSGGSKMPSCRYMGFMFVYGLGPRVYLDLTMFLDCRTGLSLFSCCCRFPIGAPAANPTHNRLNPPPHLSPSVEGDRVEQSGVPHGSGPNASRLNQSFSCHSGQLITLNPQPPKPQSALKPCKSSKILQEWFIREASELSPCALE